MKTSLAFGLMAVLFSVGMTTGAPVSATTLGTCGPANDGEVKTIAYYYPNGKLKQYYEFTCFNPAWEMTAYWVCDSQGHCTNLS